MLIHTQFNGTQSVSMLFGRQQQQLLQSTEVAFWVDEWVGLFCRHLPKCFDNVHNLEFRKDEAGDPTKGAIGMYSGKTSVATLLS